MEKIFGQAGFDVRLEWGAVGAQALTRSGKPGCLVVVDVLSFTTAVSVAVEAGTAVFPYPWRDESACAYAEQQNAALAVGRRAASPQAPWSLSPAALRDAPATPRLVLPSPNGSAICAATGDALPVLAACLRNASATADWLHHKGFGRTTGQPVLVVAAGERWPDGELRPALEDLFGAGAVISALSGMRPAGRLSPEASAAKAAFDGVTDLTGALEDCSSGRELRQAGFTEDVSIAAEVDASAVAAVRTNGAFRAEPSC